jgi:hypothetical protein
MIIHYGQSILVLIFLIFREIIQIKYITNVKFVKPDRWYMEKDKFYIEFNYQN